MCCNGFRVMSRGFCLWRVWPLTACTLACANLFSIACRQVMHVLVVAEYVLEFLFVARMAANAPSS